MTLQYLIWNGSPEIFSIGWLSLRWYGLLFALGFLLSQQILYYMFKKEGKPVADVDTLTIYMVIATILGARLGHIIFYQPEIIWTDPLGILLPFQFSPTFRFTGLQGLASHGAAFGILFALWLYSRYLISFSGTKGVDLGDRAGDPALNEKKGFVFIRRNKPGQSYIQVLDRIVILVTLTGALIRMGNFFNSEIIGKPTDGPFGVVFANPAVEGFTRDPNGPVEFVEVKRSVGLPDRFNGRKAIDVFVFFKDGVTSSKAEIWLLENAKPILDGEFFAESYNRPLNYRLIEETPGHWVARIHTLGIARHPSQLYESISCFIFFLFLFWLWTRGVVNTRPGLIFGIFMIVLWSLRFAYEYLKEPQVTFEKELPLYMGQILSIPLIIVGIIILVRALRRKV